ncbi:hypothetical protein [Streptosporangium sandarakinum]
MYAVFETVDYEVRDLPLGMGDEVFQVGEIRVRERFGQVVEDLFSAPAGQPGPTGDRVQVVGGEGDAGAPLGTGQGGQVGSRACGVQAAGDEGAQGWWSGGGVGV